MSVLQLFHVCVGWCGTVNVLMTKPLVKSLRKKVALLPDNAAAALGLIYSAIFVHPYIKDSTPLYVLCVEKGDRKVANDHHLHFTGFLISLLAFTSSDPPNYIQH